MLGTGRDNASFKFKGFMPPYSIGQQAYRPTGPMDRLRLGFLMDRDHDLFMTTMSIEHVRGGLRFDQHV